MTYSDELFSIEAIKVVFPILFTSLVSLYLMHSRKDLLIFERLLPYATVLSSLILSALCILCNNECKDFKVMDDRNSFQGSLLVLPFIQLSIITTISLSSIMLSWAVCHGALLYLHFHTSYFQFVFILISLCGLCIYHLHSRLHLLEQQVHDIKSLQFPSTSTANIDELGQNLDWRNIISNVAHDLKTVRKFAEILPS